MEKGSSISTDYASEVAKKYFNDIVKNAKYGNSTKGVSSGLNEFDNIIGCL